MGLFWDPVRNSAIKEYPLPKLLTYLNRWFGTEHGTLTAPGRTSLILVSATIGTVFAGCLSHGQILVNFQCQVSRGT